MNCDQKLQYIRVFPLNIWISNYRRKGISILKNRKHNQNKRFIDGWIVIEIQDKDKPKERHYRWDRR